MDQNVLARKNWYLRSVRLGEWNLETNPDCDTFFNGGKICAPSTYDLDVAQVIVHPEFSSFSKEQFNDIALLKFRGFVTFSDFIKPICLPESPANLDFDGLEVIVAGFGKTEVSENSRIKLKTELRGVSNAECRKVYGNDMISQRQLCAGGDFGKDSW